MSERPVWYEKHPVTPERKAELRAAGYQVGDLMFAPPDWTPPTTDPILDIPSFLEKPA